jgi:UDP-glucose-4-epimerase GalE
LVTGGAGYIGSHTVRALRRAGHGVVVIDDLRTGDRRFVEGVPLVRRDVGDRDSLERALSRHGPFDAVLHFAASISVPESIREPLRYYRNNVAASQTLIELAVTHGVRGFVLSSTAAVYGAPEQQPIAEAAPLDPRSPYGAGKAMVERMLADAERAHGMRFTALRYFNAAGADPDGGLGECHHPETHLIPVALEAVAGMRDGLVLFGSEYPTRDGTCVRDYINVSELAEADVVGVEALIEGGEGEPTTSEPGRATRTARSWPRWSRWWASPCRCERVPRVPAIRRSSLRMPRALRRTSPSSRCFRTSTPSSRRPGPGSGSARTSDGNEPTRVITR